MSSCVWRLPGRRTGGGRKLKNSKKRKLNQINNEIEFKLNQNQSNIITFIKN